MAKLKKLERLDLGDNEIEELPSHIGALVSLEGTGTCSLHCMPSLIFMSLIKDRNYKY
jgi:hypothetical protein